MTAATQLSQRPAIEYPDCDGQPMAENTLQYQWIVTLKGGLDVVFLDDPVVFVAGDLLWYPVEGQPKIRVAPDVMVAVGRPKGHRGSYMQWVEGNLAPQVVFEILSPGNRLGEMFRKFDFYQRYGVEEYYIYDPDRGLLDGWLREGELLVEIPSMDGFTSPRLGIKFDPGAGPDSLTIFGPDGGRFLTFTEWVETARAERQRAASAREIAAAEQQRADAERQRADRLAARLRELGVETD